MAFLDIYAEETMGARAGSVRTCAYYFALEEAGFENEEGFFVG